MKTHRVLIGLLGAVLFAVIVASLGTCMAVQKSSAATVVDVYPGDDLDAKANAAPAGATIQVHGSEAGSALYVYSVNNPITLKAGQTLTGDIGTVTNVGPANVPHPTVGVKGTPGMSTMLKASGDPITVSWLDLDATNTQKAINGLSGGPNLKMEHVVVHGAPASGIGQYRGTVTDSEVYGNGADPTKFDGTVSGIKCNYACEVSNSYVHDNPGNGIWCDVGCQYVANQPSGFYVHGNISGDNGRHGIFFENAPKPSINPGDDRVRALITSNIVYGNSKSGISVSDSQDGKVLSNTLGVRVDGTLDHNAGSVGIELHSSGQLDRGIQKNAIIKDNIMHQETIDGTGTNRDGTPNRGCLSNGNQCANNLDEPAPPETTTPDPCTG